MRSLILAIASLILLNACKQQTEVTISDAWVRPSTPGQSVGAAYMTINSPQNSKMVYVETASANKVEIHSMSMDNGVMKMRMMEELPLEAGKSKKLAPGGFHLMMFGLKAPLEVGDNIDFKLCFIDENDKLTHHNFTLPVKE